MENSLNKIPEELIISIMTFLGPKYLNNLKILIDKKTFKKSYQQLVDYIIKYAVTSNSNNTNFVIEVLPSYKITILDDAYLKQIIIDKFLEDKKSELYFKNWIKNKNI